MSQIRDLFIVVVVDDDVGSGGDGAADSRNGNLHFGKIMMMF